VPSRAGWNYRLPKGAFSSSVQSAKSCADLATTVIRWFPEPGAADVQRANQDVRLTADGKQMSAIGYLAKQMTTQAWYKRGLIRKRGGPVLGKRGGVTRNIGSAAIDQYFDALRADGGVGPARARFLPSASTREGSQVLDEARETQAAARECSRAQPPVAENIIVS
jgi:hypothetical protein